MANDQLSKFARALFSEATGKKLSSVKAYNEQMRLQMEEEERALKKKADRDIADYRSKYRYEVSLTIARRKNELHTALIQNRGRVFEKVFSKVVQNLQKFVQSKEYISFLEKEYAEVEETFDMDGTECIAMKDDFEKLKNVFAGKDYSFVASEKDLIGGFILRNQDSRLYVDCSLIAKLEEQKEKFYSSSGLIID